MKPRRISYIIKAPKPFGFSADEPGRAEGPVQQLVAATAERAGPETQPDRAAPAVAPGKAKAALQMAISLLEEEEVLFRHCADHALKIPAAWEECRNAKRCAVAVREAIKVLTRILPEPDSEARNERSGRRNAKCAGADASEKTL